MSAYGLMPAFLLAAGLFWSVEGSAQSVKPRPSTPQELELAQHKLALELSNAQKQIDFLERTWSQRWDEEKERIKQERERALLSIKDDRDRGWAFLKEDRDRSWDLFTKLIFSIFTTAGILWIALAWWIRFENSDIRKTLNQIPVLQSNIRSFILDMEQKWPDFASSLDDLAARAKLDQTRHQVMVEYIREFTIRLRKCGPSKDSILECLEDYGIELTMMTHLLSGNRRYVKQATNILCQATELPTIASELLPELSRLYHNLDPDMGAWIDATCEKFGIKPIQTQ
jgi:hypothetical protein